MPMASKIAYAITLGLLALNITSGLALPLTSEIGQTTDVVRRESDLTSTRTTTLVSRTDETGSTDETESTDDTESSKLPNAPVTKDEDKSRKSKEISSARERQTKKEGPLKVKSKKHREKEDMKHEIEESLAEGDESSKLD